MEQIIQNVLEKYAAKFKTLRLHKEKTDNPVAKKILEDIKEMISKDNLARAKALISKYNKRYKGKLRIEDFVASYA